MLRSISMKEIATHAAMLPMKSDNAKLIASRRLHSSSSIDEENISGGLNIGVRVWAPRTRVNKARGWMGSISRRSTERDLDIVYPVMTDGERAKEAAVR